MRKSARQSLQMEMMFAELATVIASRDLDHAGAAGGLDAGAKGLFDGRTIQAVDDDLEHRVHFVWQRARDLAAPAQRRAIGVVGGRDHLLVVFRANLAA